MLSLLGINKIMAIYVGPSGYAALGQFQNAVQMISSVAGGGLNTGVIKYTAEYQTDEVRQHKVWQSAAMLSLIAAVVLSILIFAFRAELALWFLNDKSLSNVFGWFGGVLSLFVFNAFLQSILNGKKEIVYYVISNIAGSVFSILVTTLLIVNCGFEGALIALATYQSLTFFVTLLVCFQRPWFKLKNFFGRVDKYIVFSLAKFASMALTSAAIVPLSQILIRNYLGDKIGWAAAGYWEAMWRLSGAYLMFVTTTLGVYYLPKLSELNGASEIKKEVLNGYKIILPAVGLVSFFVYLSRSYLIDILFSAEFQPMSQLFFWQLIGDILKISGWLLAYVMLSKAMTLAYILSEVVFSLGFYFLVVLLVELYGMEGAAMAHALNYLIYTFVLVIYIFGLKGKM